MSYIKGTRLEILDESEGEVLEIYTDNDISHDKLFHLKHDVISSRKASYFVEYGTFDIETTSLDDKGFMYMWQFCLNETVYMGRTWEEFGQFINNLEDEYHFSPYNRFVIYVHFLGFEFQFIRNFMEWQEVFSLDKRVPVRALTTSGIEFRCSYKMSNMSLAKLCEAHNVKHYKKSGEKFNYSIRRYPWTDLSDYELIYGYCDVKGLHEAIDHEFEVSEYNISTIPMTSTGFVREKCRKMTLANPNNRMIIKETSLDVYLYTLLRTGRRGGDCHASPYYSSQLLDNIRSKDIKSSYPYVMVALKFPMTKFVETDMYGIDGRAYICIVEYHNIEVKNHYMIGYMPKAKLLTYSGAVIDNGRVLRADMLRVILTDIDIDIVDSRYDYESREFVNMFSAEYGYLPYELRMSVFDYFKYKCEKSYEGGYYYGKSKNELNAIFGMMLTDICQGTIVYDGEWSEEQEDPFILLEKYYNNRKSFLAYQWGVWVTAHARYRLDEPYRTEYRYAVYSDTDSWKLLDGYNEQVFEHINSRVIQDSKQLDVPTSYTDSHGVTSHLGVWEDEGMYSQFITLGAKKYAYVKDGKLHVTVSGLGKESGAAYINKIGGISKFKDDVEIPCEYSGRTVSIYDDVDKPFYLDVDGKQILTASSIAVHETTYTLGRSSEYVALLDELETYGKNNII